MGPAGVHLIDEQHIDVADQVDDVHDDDDDSHRLDHLVVDVHQHAVHGDNDDHHHGNHYHHGQRSTLTRLHARADTHRPNAHGWPRQGHGLYPERHRGVSTGWPRPRPPHTGRWRSSAPPAHACAPRTIAASSLPREVFALCRASRLSRRPRPPRPPRPPRQPLRRPRRWARTGAWAAQTAPGPAPRSSRLWGKHGQHLQAAWCSGSGHLPMARA